MVLPNQLRAMLIKWKNKTLNVRREHLAIYDDYDEGWTDGWLTAVNDIVEELSHTFEIDIADKSVAFEEGMECDYEPCVEIAIYSHAPDYDNVRCEAHKIW